MIIEKKNSKNKSGFFKSKFLFSKLIDRISYNKKSKLINVNLSKNDENNSFEDDEIQIMSFFDSVKCYQIYYPHNNIENVIDNFYSKKSKNKVLFMTNSKRFKKSIKARFK